MKGKKKTAALILSAVMLLSIASCRANIPTGEESSALTVSSQSSSLPGPKGEEPVSSGESSEESQPESSQEGSEPDDVTESLPDLQAPPVGGESSSQVVQSSGGDARGGQSVQATVTYQNGALGYYPALVDYEPAYDRLTGDQKTAYRAIATAVSYMRTGKFYFNPDNLNQQGVTLTRSEVLLAYSAVMSDHPEYFWMSKTYVTNKQDCVYMECTYNCTPAQKVQKQAQIRQQLNAFLSGLTGGMSQLALEKAAHDFVVSRTSYGYGGASPSDVDSDAYNIYGGLVSGSAVCEGYARSIQYLCTQVGLECVLQRGTAVSNVGQGRVDHMWNAVKIEGRWYQLDASWNDPVYSDGAQRISYDYFNLTKQQIQSNSGRQRTFYALAGSSNQTELSNFSLPECNSIAASYSSNSWAFVHPGEAVGTIVNQAILEAQSRGLSSVEVFLDAGSGSTFANSVYGCVDINWIANTGITHLICTGLGSYVKVSW